MKRSFCFLLFVLLIFGSLFSCARREITPVRDDISADALMQTVLGSLTDAGRSAKDGYVPVGEHYINESMWGEDYGALSEALDDYAVCLSDHADTNIDEIGVFHVKEDYDPVEIADIARNYLRAQCLRYHSLLEAYNPAELPKADAGGDVIICGQYVLYTLLDAAATAKVQASFKRALTADR